VGWKLVQSHTKVSRITIQERAGGNPVRGWSFAITFSPSETPSLIEPALISFCFAFDPRRNCNHFSESLCAKLGLSMPGWVNRPARMAGALGLGPSAQAQQLDLDGRPLREEDRAALVLTHAQDVCIDALLDRPALGCLGAKPAHSLAAVIPCDAKGNRTQLRPDAVLSSDADEQLLLFLPFTRALRICSLLLRVSSRDAGLGSNPRTLKLYADRRNVDFSDVDEITPTQVAELPSRPADGRAFTKLEQKEGVWELVVPLNMAKFHSCAFLTLFVETNHGAPTTSIHGLTIVGRDK